MGGQGRREVPGKDAPGKQRREWQQGMQRNQRGVLVRAQRLAYREAVLRAGTQTTKRREKKDPAEGG